MELIDRLKLHPLIFLYNPAEVTSASDPSSEPSPPDYSTSLLASRVVDDLLHTPSSVSALHPLLRFTVVPHSASADAAHDAYPSATALHEVFPTTIKRFFLAAGLLPLRDLEVIEKKKTVWVGEKVVKDGIKGPTADWVWVRKAREAHLLLSAGVQKLAGEGAVEGEGDRAELGECLTMASWLRDTRRADP